MPKPIISADSHVTEPPDTYTARIDKRFLDRAPHLVRDPQRGDIFVVDGMDKPIPMLLCNHPDFDYKKACFDAYNLWVAEYAGAHPDRLIGIGQTAMRSVAEGIEDLRCRSTS